MEGAHSQASGMGGMRAAGDLVARMQMTRRMRLKEAKRYVAGKLGCTPRDLSDPVAMETIRVDKGLGTLAATSSTRPGDAGMIEAKFNISRLLDIPINCVERFKDRAHL
jgi:dimethylamine---corrinoid protein Co-methyltransferase